MRVGQSADGFAVIEVKCPSCGAPLQVPEDAASLTCGFCGSTLHVSRPQGPGAGGVGSGIDPDGTIRDRTTGYGLFRGDIPQGWTVAGTALQRTGTLSRPFLPQVALEHAGGALMSIQQGEAGTRQGAGMGMLSAMYGQAAAPYDTSNYAEMPNPLAVADTCASTRVRDLGASGLRFLGQAAPRSVGDAQRRASEHYLAEARGKGIMLGSFLGAQVLRLYAFSLGGNPWRMAVFVEAWGAKGGLSGLGGSMEGLAEMAGGLFGGLGAHQQQNTSQPAYGQATPGAQTPATSGAQGALEFFMGGGLIGKRMRESRAAQQGYGRQGYGQQGYGQQDYGRQDSSVQASQAHATPSPQQASQQSTAAEQAWCVPDFATFNQGGTVYWSIDRVITLIAPDDIFDTLLDHDFLSVVQSVLTHPDVLSLAQAESQQTDAAIQANTQVALSQSNARFAAQQAAHRQQQAAFNSYNDSISAARDARQASFRAATNAQFAGTAAGAGRGSADFSEAIRGVNTYVTSDGREVELSVHAERAYENQAGDVVGGSGGFDPGADWTEIPRA